MSRITAFGRVFLLCACLAGMSALSACRKAEPPPVPTLRSEALLEILRLLDMKDYRAALPKIERYQELDETNAFLGELRNIVVSNMVLSDAGKLASSGDLEGAVRKIDEAMAKYGNLDGLVKGREQCMTVLEIRNRIRALRQPCTGAVMADLSRKLLADGQRTGDPIIINFARQKLSDSVVMRKLEYDYAGFLIYADARDEFENGNLSMAMPLYALLAAEGNFPYEIARLTENDLYTFHGPEEGKEAKKRSGQFQGETGSMKKGEASSLAKTKPNNKKTTTERNKK